MEVAWKNVTGVRVSTPVGAHALTAWMVLAVCSASPHLVDLQLSWSAYFASLLSRLGSRAPTGSVECWRWTWRSRPPSPSRSSGPSGSPHGRPAQTSPTAKPPQPSAPCVRCVCLHGLPLFFCQRGDPAAIGLCALWLLVPASGPVPDMLRAAGPPWQGLCRVLTFDWTCTDRCGWCCRRACCRCRWRCCWRLSRGCVACWPARRCLRRLPHAPLVRLGCFPWSLCHTSFACSRSTASSGKVEASLLMNLRVPGALYTGTANGKLTVASV